MMTDHTAPEKPDPKASDLEVGDLDTISGGLNPQPLPPSPARAHPPQLEIVEGEAAIRPGFVLAGVRPRTPAPEQKVTAPQLRPERTRYDGRARDGAAGAGKGLVDALSPSSRKTDRQVGKARRTRWALSWRPANSKPPRPLAAASHSRRTPGLLDTRLKRF